MKSNFVYLLSQNKTNQTPKKPVINRHSEIRNFTPKWQISRYIESVVDVKSQNQKNFTDDYLWTFHLRRVRKYYQYGC